MDGEIDYQDKQTIILYSPQESAKRMAEYKQIKEEAKQEAAQNPVIEEKEVEQIKDEQAQEYNQSLEERAEKPEKPKRKTKTKQMKIDDIT